MAKALVYLVNGGLSPNVETTDTFASWIDTTNQLVYDMGTVVLTATANAQPNGTTSAAGWTIGNSHLEGFLSANTLIAATALRGGTVSTTTDLTITSNTIFSQGSLVLVGANTNNFTVNANNALFTSNVAIASTSKTFTISAANTTINDGAVYVKTSAWFTGATTDILGTSAIVTSNTTFTSNTMFANVDVITLGANATDSLVVNSIADFNSNTNVDGILTVTANANFTGTNTTFTAIEATGEIRLKGAAARVLKTQSTSATLYDLQVVLANTAGSVTPLVVNSTGILPGVTTTFDLGGTSFRWNKGWVKDLDVANSAVITNQLSVSGNVAFTGANTTVTDLEATGEIRLKGAVAETIRIQSTTASQQSLNVILTSNAAVSVTPLVVNSTSVSPGATTTFELGTTSARWNKLWVKDIDVSSTTGVGVNLSANVVIGKDLTISGNLTVNGTTTLASNVVLSVAESTFANTTVTNLFTMGAVARINSDFLPLTTTTYNLGSTSLRFTNVWATTFNGALSGNATTATTLQNARTINGVSFNGSANITVTANTNNTLTRGTYLTGANFDGSSATTWAVHATDLNTASKVVARDANGSFAANTITATTVTANLTGAVTGNASTATTLQTARTINGVSFNGSANITVTANTNATHTRGTYLTGGNFDGSTAVTWAVDADTAATASKVVVRDASSNFAANTITAALTGNASTATSLQTGRTINGVSFNGSANITVTANTNALLTRGTYLTGSNFDGSTATTWAVDATTTATASKVVVRDATSNFAANTITAALAGNASTATTLETARNINGVPFDGSANITVTANTNATLTRGTYLTGSNFNGSTATTWAVDADSAATASKVVARDASSNFAANTITAALFSGSGASLTSLNGTNISSGTVADARIATTLVRTSTTLTPGEGVYGGGDFSANRSFGVDTTVVRTANTQTITGVTTMSNLRLSGSMLPTVTDVTNLGSATFEYLNVYSVNFVGTATSAKYADLAEYYLADAVYGIGTVVAVGGTAEVTAATDLNGHSVIGVVSENPAFIMNSELVNGTAIALKGRVKVKVCDEVKKGDRLAASNVPGYAWVDNTKSGWSFAIALEDGIDLVEAVIL